MSADRLPGLILPLVFLIAVVGVWWALRRERREPTSYTRRPDVLEAWREMSAAQQEAYDNAQLNAAESAEVAAARASSLYRS